MKSPTDAVSNVTVGIDLHPDSFAAAVATGTTARNIKIVQNLTKVPVDNWSKFLQNNIPAKSKIIFEASANTFEFARLAEEHGHSSVVLESNAASTARSRHCKNDRKDALSLVKVYLGDLPSEIWKPDETTRIYRELENSYDRAVTDYNRTSNRLKSFLNEHKLRIRKPHHLNKPMTRNWIYESYQWDENQRFMLQELFLKYDQARECRQRHLERIAKIVTDNSYIAQLLRLCGVGIVNAFSIIAAVGDINRFASPKKLVAYIGLAPTVNESGNGKRKSYLQHGGRVRLKAKLIQASQSIIKSKSEGGRKIREWGIRLMMKKNRNLATAAVARKLVVAIWYALNGFIPEILEEDKEFRRKLRNVAACIGESGVKSINYSCIKKFIDSNIDKILTAQFYQQKLRN